MTTQDLNNFAKDTEKVLGIGTVVKTKLVPNVYFEFTMNNEDNAKKLEELWNKSFTHCTVSRNGLEVMAG